MNQRKRLYRIDAGNSSTGPVGFVARIWATSKEQAIERIKEVLPEGITALRAGDYDNPHLREVRVYFGDNLGDFDIQVEYEDEDGEQDGHQVPDEHHETRTPEERAADEQLFAYMTTLE